MTEKELKKLFRKDLRKMIIEQNQELEDTREKLYSAEAALKKREISIDKAGTLAEAALQINEVFDAAQAAGQQYLENIRLLSERQEGICNQLEAESKAEADKILTEAKKTCENMEKETRILCNQMVANAKAESQQYWDDVSKKLEEFYQEHIGLKELLSCITQKKEPS